MYKIRHLCNKTRHGVSLRFSKKNELRKLIKNIVVGINLFAVLLLCLAYLARVVDPEMIAFLQIFGLGYFYSLILNIGFVVFWIVKRSKWLLLSLVFIFLGWVNLQSTFQINFSAQAEESIKLLSYNVRAFDRFDWTKQKDAKQKIFNYIEKEQADIICYQEFFSKEKKGLSTFDTLLILQKAKKHHLAYYKRPNKLNLSGVATFSVYPILNKGKIEYDGNVISIFTDLKIKNDTIRVYNNHLQSIHFGVDNYSFIDNIEEADEDKVVDGIADIYRKLIKGYGKRAAEAKTLKQHMNKCKYPLIICGDFNDSATSYAYNKIRGELNDAFEEVGSGFDFSYVRGILNFRIDFILHSPAIIPLNFESKSLNYSDHYPVKFEFYLK